MNEFQELFVSEIKRVSVNISDYLDNRLYRTQFEDEESITPSVIFNLVMDMACQELLQLGIQLDLGDSKYVEVDAILAIRLLRVSFDKDGLLKRMIGNYELADTVLNTTDELEETTGYIHLLVDSILNNNSLAGLAFDHLKTTSAMFSSNDVFIDHVRHIAEEATGATDEVNPELLVEFAKTLHAHNKTVKQNVLYIIQHPTMELPETDIAMLTKRIDKAYRYIAGTFPPVMMNYYLDDKDPHPMFKPGVEFEQINSIKQTSKIFLDYYFVNAIDQFTYQELILISSEYYRIAWTKEENIEFIEKELKKFSLPMEAMVYIKEYMHLLSQRITI